MFRRFRDNAVPYLAELSKRSSSRDDASAIRSSIEVRGYWETQDEWRISTVTSKRIEKTDRCGHVAYHVRVSCDHEFSCYTPTLERAIEFLGIYEKLIMDCFWTVGWPSWATREKLTP
jgi:hypothetical protein